MFELILFFIVMFILYSVSIFSSYVSSKVSCDGIVNEDNKKIITSAFVINLIIQMFFIVYIKSSDKYTIMHYSILFFVIIGIIISLIYIAQRNN